MINPIYTEFRRFTPKKLLIDFTRLQRDSSYKTKLFNAFGDFALETAIDSLLSFNLHV